MFLPASVTSLQVTHTTCVRSALERGIHNWISRESAVRIVNVWQCTGSAPGRLSSMRGKPSPAFPTVLVPLPPRRSGIDTRGDCNLNCWREWRRASPYLLPHPSDSAAAPRDWKPALRTLGHRLCASHFILRGG